MEIKIGKLTAICSFLIGTFLFLTYLITNNSGFLPIGFYYLIIIIPLNLTVLLVVIASVLFRRDKYREYLKTIGLMLLNIPIAWLYFNILTF